MKIDNGNNAVRAFSAQASGAGAAQADGNDMVAKAEAMVDSWGIAPGGCFPPPPQPGGDIGRILQQLMQLIQQLMGGGGIGPGGEKPTLNFGDRFTAGRLHSTLSNPWKNWMTLNNPNVPNATLTRGADGVVRGPEGQPLVQVQLDDGNTAYVDPNTNKYYLGNGADFFGRIQTKGPMDLPPGSRFSNSHFSDADARQLSRDAASHFGQLPPWLPRPPLPFPRPIPIDPIPFPRRLPVDLPVQILSPALRGVIK
jgi:hypothetical protein